MAGILGRLGPPAVRLRRPNPVGAHGPMAGGAAPAAETRVAARPFLECRSRSGGAATRPYERVVRRASRTDSSSATDAIVRRTMTSSTERDPSAPTRKRSPLVVLF